MRLEPFSLKSTDILALFICFLCSYTIGDEWKTVILFIMSTVLSACWKEVRSSLMANCLWSIIK